MRIRNAIDCNVQEFALLFFRLKRTDVRKVYVLNRALELSAVRWTLLQQRKYAFDGD